MQISERKCVAYGNCVPVCLMGAIHRDPARNRATVHSGECVECYACFRGMSFEHLNPWLVRTVRGLLWSWFASVWQRGVQVRGPILASLAFLASSNFPR